MICIRIVDNYIDTAYIDNYIHTAYIDNYIDTVYTATGSSLFGEHM